MHGAHGAVGVNSLAFDKLQRQSHFFGATYKKKLTSYITLSNQIYSEYHYNSWCRRNEMNHLCGVINAGAHQESRPELTSAAIKSFMTLQCCGPRRARPASTNLCLRSDSKRTHTHIHHCTLKPRTKIIPCRRQLQVLHTFSLVSTFRSEYRWVTILGRGGTLRFLSCEVVLA